MESPQLEAIATTGTSATVTNLTLGVTYTFTVRARNDTGFSDYSNTVTQTAAQEPDKIQNISFLVNQTSLALNWTVPYNGGSQIVNYTVMI